MGRPRVLIGRRLIERLYVDQGLSVRETARALGVGTAQVRRRLVALGIGVRGVDEAAQTMRVRVAPSEGPACRACGASGREPLCVRCAGLARRAGRRGRCAWRDCRENGIGGWCYAHRKRIEGLMS